MTDNIQIQAIAMPKWGMTMIEGRMAEWLCEVGDKVEPGQDLMEIETEKITNVVESYSGGLLRRILLAGGETAPVGALIGVLAGSGVSEEEIDKFIATYASPIAGSDVDADERPAPRIVPAGDHKVNVFSMGEGDATPVVLLHGFGSDQGAWLFNQDALAADRPVHMIDLPAHGGSAPGPGTVAQIAAAVIATLEVLGLDRAHLVGHSLGGAVALTIAETEPGKVASLALIAPAGLGAEISTDFIDGFLAADRRRPMKEVLSTLFADPSVMNAEMVQNVLRFKRQDGVPEALTEIAQNLVANGQQAIDLRNTLAQVEVPVLVIWGEKDAVIPATQSDYLPTTIHVERISDAGHMPMMESAANVNRQLSAHLAAADV